MYFIIRELLAKYVVKCCQGCVFKLLLQNNTLHTELDRIVGKLCEAQFLRRDNFSVQK